MERFACWSFVALFRFEFRCVALRWQAIKHAENPALKQPNMADTVKMSFRLNGLRAPFQGLGPTIMRNAPANAVYLGSFECFKSMAAELYVLCPFQRSPLLPPSPSHFR